MRVGNVVTYLDAAGRAQDATVTGVVGSGPSGYKRLDLSVGSESVSSVAHIGDADGGSCWCFPQESPEKPVVMGTVQSISAAMVNISKVDFSAGGAAETHEDSHDDSQD